MRHSKEEPLPSLSRSGLLVGVLTLAGCAQQPQPPAAPPDTRAADEAAIHAAVKEWSAAAQAKDVDKFISVYAEDAVVMLEDAPDISGKAAIREAISGMMQDPDFALSFEANKVVGGALRRPRLRDRHLRDDDERREEEAGDGEGPLRGRLAEAGGRRVEGRVDAPMSDPPQDAAK